MADTTWTGQDGSINYIGRNVTEHTLEQLGEVEYDIRRERREHYEGCNEVDVDYRLIEARKHLNDAIRRLRSYVDDCKKWDAEYAALQRQVS